MAKLDNIDYQLLRVLRDDARLSLRDIGSKVSLSAPTVAQRIKHLEELGIISGYKTEIIIDKSYLCVDVIIDIKCTFLKSEALLNFLKGSDNVYECLCVSGDFDYSIRASFENRELLYKFIDYLNKEFGTTKTTFIFKDEIKRRSLILKDKKIL